jgi:hypothetical protein
MKPSDSNSLLRALAGTGGGAHPDSDLLNAFAEGSLLARERETVMGHLAVCAECREVVSLCASGQEDVRAREIQLVAAAAAVQAEVPALVTAAAPIQRKPRPALRGWIQWAALAAGIAIVSVISLRYGQKKTEPIAAAPPSTLVAVNAPPSKPAPLRPVPRREDQRPRIQPQAPALKKAPARVPAVREEAPARLEPLPQQTAAQDALRADTENALQEAQQPNAAQGTTEAYLRDQQKQSANIAAAPQAAAARAPSAALAGSFAKSAGLVRPPGPAWRIDGAGRIERSFGGDRWEPLLTGETAKMHVVSTNGSVVWAGGENDRLYRSNDEGATWQPVTLPQKNGAGHVLANIRFTSALAGTIDAADGTTWSTSDGGATWN